MEGAGRYGELMARWVFLHAVLTATRTASASESVGSSSAIIQPCQDLATVLDAQFTSGWHDHPKPDSNEIYGHPTESNMKSVNIKKEFHVHHAVFRLVPCFVSKKF